MSSLTLVFSKKGSIKSKWTYETKSGSKGSVLGFDRKDRTWYKVAVIV